MKNRILLLILFSFVLFTGSNGLRAQGVTTSAMKGLVLDAKGEPLPGPP